MLTNERFLITGSESMIGRAICKELEKYTYIYKFKHKLHDNYADWEAYDYIDLLDTKSTIEFFESVKPKFVIHLGGYNGNLEFNKKFPEEIYYKTAQMGLNVLRACVEAKVKKVCSLISSCAYPPNLGLIEESFLEGPPHESVEAHGFAKQTLVQYGRQIKKQHNIDCINICVNHVYGPHDNFNPEKTKVMGSLIRKFSDAKKNNLEYVELWGSGGAKREFIYVDDVAKYLCQAFEVYNDSFQLLNIGSQTEISIADLANLVKKIVGYEGKIRWNGWPDGQKSKLLDNSKMKRILGDLTFTSLEEGIQKTVEWYNDNI